MEWFYAQSDERFGPYGDAEFAQLVANGNVNASTLVWHEGLANWQAYCELVAPAGLSQSSQSASAVATVANDQVGHFAYCAQCDRYTNTQEMVAYENSWVCPDCKDLFFQRIREGISPLQTPHRMFRYAGFWIRFVAAFIDGLALGVVNCAINGIAGQGPFSGGAYGHASGSLGQTVALSVIGLAMWAAYETWLIGAYGATLGKMALGLRVVRPDGQKVSYGRAFGRYRGKRWFLIIAEMISWVYLANLEHGDLEAVQRFMVFMFVFIGVGLIGYVIAGFTEQKKALHDMICGTRVVHK